MRKITIIHPSRERPGFAATTAKKWLSSAKYPDNIEYLLSIDESDRTRVSYKAVFPAFNSENRRILINKNKTAIEAINTAALSATGDILIVVSDDFSCPAHWDEGLLTALEGKSDFVVKTQDGIQPFIITLPIMDRVYFERFGYIYNRGYFHLWSDTEMSAVGWMLDRTITLDIKFPHNHYTTGKAKKDAISHKNDRTWKQGEDLYNQRKAVNFDLTPEQIVKPFPSHAL